MGETALGKARCSDANDVIILSLSLSRLSLLILVGWLVLSLLIQTIYIHLAWGAAETRLTSCQCSNLRGEEHLPPPEALSWPHVGDTLTAVTSPWDGAGAMCPQAGSQEPRLVAPLGTRAVDRQLSRGRYPPRVSMMVIPLKNQHIICAANSSSYG